MLLKIKTCEFHRFFYDNFFYYTFYISIVYKERGNMNISPINFTSTDKFYKKYPYISKESLYPIYDTNNEYLNPLIIKEQVEPEPKISTNYLARINRIKEQIKKLEGAEKRALSGIKARQQQILDDANQKISALNQQKAEIQRQTSKSIFELESILKILEGGNAK